LLVKRSAHFLAAPLTHVINLSSRSGDVPKRMKQARVRAIYKNEGDRKLCGNYRSISILAIYSKILERVVNNQLHSYFSTSKIITPSRYGFHRSKGTLDALIDFTNNSLKALNDGKVVFGVPIDFSKAFDTLDHHILLAKLDGYGFSVQTVKWFKSYPCDRSQSLQLGNTVSEPYQITCGVPQGSILGPSLFVLYMNDLINKTGVFTPILFADDTNLFFVSRSLNDDLPTLNKQLDKIADWCYSNNLTLNTKNASPQLSFHSKFLSSSMMH